MSTPRDKSSLGLGISRERVDAIFAGVFREEEIKRKERMKVMLARHHCRFHCPRYPRCLTATRSET